MSEVTEKDIDISEARKSQNQIYQEQAQAGLTEAPEVIEQSKQDLREDINSRLQNPKQEQPQNPEPLQERQEVPERQERKPEDILKELGLKEEPKKRVIRDTQGNEREYIQKPLSFLGKMQFLSYIGEVLDKAMSGNNALQLNSLFDVPTRGDMLSAQDFSDAQTFIQGVGKLLIYAPDFLVKSYCIWLRIPEYEREWAAEAFEESLTDEEGIDIIDTFIDQNWETLQGFFNERIPKLRDRLQARYRVSQSAQ